MLDLLLNIYITPLTVFVNELLSMGLPLIDKNLEQLLDTMEDSPLSLSSLVGLAKTIGSCLALCVGSYECWMMILGKRGLDVMKLVRIAGIAICINASTTICNMAKAPGMALEKEMRAKAAVKNQQIDAMQIEVAKKQKSYADSIREVDTEAETKQYGTEMAKADGWFEKLGVRFDHYKREMKNYLKEQAVTLESKAGELINSIIRFIGEVLFQMMYYGMLLAQRCFMAILGMFCPIAFALSLAPPFKLAWSQWLSKYISLSLWGFVVYCVLFYTDYLIYYFLQQDLTAYTKLLGSAGSGSTMTGVKFLGVQSVGTTIAYVVSMFVGCKVLSMVPEVSSWLIPGGVSSGAGGAAMGAAGMVFSYAAGAARTTVREGRNAISTISHGGSASSNYANSKSSKS